MLVWTDGACQRNPGPGGWAALVCWEDGVVEEHSGGLPRTTNNIMEMTAALQGLRALPSGSRVCIVTDSRYLHDGMTSWMAGWKRRGWKTAAGDPVKNREVWLELEAASDRARAGALALGQGTHRPCAERARRRTCGRGNAQRRPLGRLTRNRPRAGGACRRSRAGTPQAVADELDLDAVRMELQTRLDRDRRRVGKLAERPERGSAVSFGKRVGDGTTEAVSRLTEIGVGESLERGLGRTERALAKLDEGSYGLCDACGVEISPGRLKAMPDGILCVQCSASQRRAHPRRR